MHTEEEGPRQPELACELSCLSRPDGSAQFSANAATRLLCSVFGPGEVKLAKELASRAHIGVTYKPRTGQPANKDKVNEYALRSVCDGAVLAGLHPRTAVSLVLQELETDGSAGNQLACALNCACLALLDAAVPLRHTFAAVHCSLLDERVLFFAAPDLQAASALSATFVLDSLANDVLFVSTSGLFDQDKFASLLKAAQHYANTVLFPFFTQQIKLKYQLSLQE
jgi:exosome complex component RRP46